MTAIYNENDAYPAQWMRNLIAAGHIAPGVVDEGSIADLTPDDVSGPGQRHFFAGIGGWSYALRLAGIADDANVWTGSCPCQPFSSAGRGGGFDDVRHLWPEWYRLIRECRPPIVFGEQVASPDGLKWFDAVSTDLEGAGYAVAAADLCAAGVGAPHMRQRLYFVAYTGRERLEGERLCLLAGQSRPADTEARGHGEARGCVAHADQPDAIDGHKSRSRRLVQPAPHKTPGFWSSADWLPCIDEKSRPVEPGTFPLAHGVPGRVGKLRGYGNAIVPQVAATFIRAALEAIGG